MRPRRKRTPYLNQLRQRMVDAWNVPSGTAAHDILLTVLIESDGSLRSAPLDHSSRLWQDPLIVRMPFRALGQGWTGPGRDRLR